MDRTPFAGHFDAAAITRRERASSPSATTPDRTDGVNDLLRRKPESGRDLRVTVAQPSRRRQAAKSWGRRGGWHRRHHPARSELLARSRSRRPRAS
jgi:hypothetical protein